MSTIDVERALNSTIAERGHQLISLVEDQWFERKSVRVAPKDLAVALTAFANAEGGVVVVGLHDGRVEGTKNSIDHNNALRQAAIDHTAPPVRAHVDQLACINDAGEADTLLIFRVSPGDTVHELKNGDCYLRVGDESRKLGFAQRQELHFDRGGAPFDGLPVPGVKVGELDHELVRGYKAAAGATDTDTRLLKARSLLTSDGHVTVAGYLLFYPNPSERFPQAQIRVIRYRGSIRGTGVRLEIDAGHDRRIEGPIPRAINEAREVIADWQPKRRMLSAAGVFAEEPVVPADAWLEGLVNAVVHRSYSLAGDHVRVEIFSDRIEIESPGRFPGLADPNRPLDVSRYARNPRIARVCTDLAITQELGEGIKRMFDEMRGRGLTDPLYQQTQGSVRLILSGLSRIPADVVARLPRGSLDTLNALRATGRALGTGELMELLSVSRPTLVKQLNALRDEGLVIWSGKSARDPRAAWEAA